MSNSKSDNAWVAVRFIGLIFVALSLMSLFEFPITYYSMERYSETLPEDKQSIYTLTNLYSSLIITGAKFVLYSALAVYFLRWGRLFHRLLMYPIHGKET